MQQSTSFAHVLPFDLQAPFVAPPELDEHAASKTRPTAHAPTNRSVTRMREACAQKSALAICDRPGISNLVATATNASAAASLRGDRALHVAVGVYLLFSVVNLGCMAVYGPNHSMEIPLLEHAHDPSLFPNDPLTGTFAYHASYYWKIVAALTQHARFEPFLRAFVILQRGLMLYAFGSLARFFAPKSQLAMVACLGALALGIPYLQLGSSDVGLAIYAEQSSLTLAFVLLALVAFLRFERLWWAFFLAAAALLNIFLSVHVFVFFAFAFVLVDEYRTEWRRWIPAAALFGVLTLPLLPLLLPALHGTSASSELWIQAHRIRSAHHLFPLTWPLSAYVRLFSVTALALVASRMTMDATDIRARLFAAFCAGALFWLAMAFAAANVFHSVSFLCLQPGRALSIFEDLGIVVLLCALARLAEERSRTWMVALAVAIAWLANTQGVMQWQALLVSLVLLAVMLSRVIPKYAGIQLDSRSLAIALTIVFVPRVVLGALGDRNPTSSFAAAFTRDSMPSYAAVAEDAKLHSTIDETFLVPPDWELFRPVAERSVFVTYKDGTASFYDRDYLVPWLERLRALGFDLLASGVTPENAPDLLAHAYDALDDSAVAAIRARYRVDVWIVPSSKASHFPVVFERDGFKALDLTPVAKADR